MTTTVGIAPVEPGPDETARAAVHERGANVLRPKGALARLDDVAAWLAAWQRTPRPGVERPAALVFAADHGVADEGVSAYPATVTKAMLHALQQGVATAAALARSTGTALHVVDVGVGRPTVNSVLGPALDERRFAEAWHAGEAAVGALDADLLAVGEMGIGNTTSAAAVAALLFGGDTADWVGPGTGLDAAGVAAKIAVVERIRARAGVVAPMEALRQAGGAELVAIAGAVAAARRRSLPVVLDGFITTAAVAPLAVSAVGALDHCLAAHRSAEPGHGRLLERLDLRPLLTLDLRLGEASGALVAVPIVRAAAAAVVDVATFAEWGVPGRE
jgi:nicotinate-nucleotide--dimethylbenzimidazole phosphoribosyltransferase